MSGGKEKSKPKKKSGRKGLFSLKVIFISVAACLLIAFAGFMYVFFMPNVNAQAKSLEIFLTEEATFDSLQSQMREHKMLKNEGTFWWASRAYGYFGKVKPGHYLLKTGMSNKQMLDKLRHGIQDPVKVTFKSRRTLQDIARDLDPVLEISKEELVNAFEDKLLLDTLGLNSANLISIFIPNTYELYWNISAKELVKKMKKAFDKFWVDKRVKRADALGLSRFEVMTLASIVQAETYMPKERPTIAGVYLNRLKKGMRLEADPTVIFATGDFSIRRVLKSHLQFDSPYNTYLYAGLPPGPINNPEISAIDGVLYADEHDYIFFCAKSDFSGYHTFSKTLSEHLQAAADYHQALNRQRR